MNKMKLWLFSFKVNKVYADSFFSDSGVNYVSGMKSLQISLFFPHSQYRGITLGLMKVSSGVSKLGVEIITTGHKVNLRGRNSLDRDQKKTNHTKLCIVLFQTFLIHWTLHNAPCIKIWIQSGYKTHFNASYPDKGSLLHFKNHFSNWSIAHSSWRFWSDDLRGVSAADVCNRGLFCFHVLWGRWYTCLESSWIIEGHDWDIRRNGEQICQQHCLDYIVKDKIEVQLNFFEIRPQPQLYHCVSISGDEYMFIKISFKKNTDIQRLWECHRNLSKLEGHEERGRQQFKK